MRWCGKKIVLVKQCVIWITFLIFFYHLVTSPRSFQGSSAKQAEWETASKEIPTAVHQTSSTPVNKTSSAAANKSGSSALALITVMPAISSTTNHSSAFEKLALSLKNKPFTAPDEYIAYTNLRLVLKQLQNEKPIRPDFGPVVNNLTAISFSINIQPCANTTKLLISVVTSPNNLFKRMAIRETWKKNFNSTTNSIVIFSLGLTNNDENLQSKIREESSIYGDIIQSNIIDSYRTLDQKFVDILQWININCPNVSFVLKCDDDVYVNVYNLNTLIKNTSMNDKIIYGARHGNLGVQRPGDGGSLK